MAVGPRSPEGWGRGRVLGLPRLVLLDTPRRDAAVGFCGLLGLGDVVAKGSSSAEVLCPSCNVAVTARHLANGSVP